MLLSTKKRKTKKRSAVAQVVVKPEVLTEIQEAAADIRAGKFPPKLGFWCKFCDYESVCPAREQGAAASASGEE